MISAAIEALQEHMVSSFTNVYSIKWCHCVFLLLTLEGAWVDNLQCSGHTLAEDNLAYVTKGTRELQRQTHHVILQQRDSQQSVS